MENKNNARDNGLMRFWAGLALSAQSPNIVWVAGGDKGVSLSEAVLAVLMIKFRVCYVTLEGGIDRVFSAVISGENDHAGSFGFGAAVKGLRNIIFKNEKYPQCIVIDIGGSDADFINDLSLVVVPSLAVIAEGAEKDEDSEKSVAKILRSVKKGGFCILSSDSKDFGEMKDKCRGYVISYGSNEDADVKISSFNNENDNFGSEGDSFKIEALGNMVPLRFDERVSEDMPSASSAAVAAGISADIGLIDAVESIQKLYAEPSPFRHPFEKRDLSVLFPPKRD